MLRKLILICACLCSVPALCQSVGSTKYQVATVLTVDPHSSDANAYPSAPSYDVALQVGNTVYVVLCTPRYGLQTAKYAAGRQVLVLVGEKTLTYNDIYGDTVALPIVARKVVAAAPGR